MLAPDIDPVAIHLGPLKIHWYGLMYLIGFLGAWWLGVYRAKRPGSGWHPQEVADFIFYGALGVILGGRLGYVLFYNLGYFLDHPVEVFYIWSGGMSFHGAGPLPRHPSQLYEFMLEGVALFLILWFYARKPRPTSAVSGLFLLCYGTFRFLVEFAREPDAHLGYLACCSGRAGNPSGRRHSP